jgi:hypothetical protein
MDLAACQMEGMRTYSHLARTARYNDVADFTFLCMEAKGYRSSDCGLTAEVAETAIGCYTPRAWVARLFDS